MPNHVTSRVAVIGPEDQINAFREFAIVGDEFDFGRIIPMPESVKATEASSWAEVAQALIIARGSSVAPFANLGLYEHEIQRVRTEAGLAVNARIGDVAAAWLAKYPDREASGMARLRAIVETGYTDWFSWSCAKWGTKWNSYRFAELSAESGYMFRFETAWSFPVPIFEALAERFPALTFDCACYDEGSNFAGIGQFGAMTPRPFAIVEATDEIYEIVHGHPPERDEDEDEAA